VASAGSRLPWQRLITGRAAPGLLPVGAARHSRRIAPKAVPAVSFCGDYRSARTTPTWRPSRIRRSVVARDGPELAVYPRIGTSGRLLLAPLWKAPARLRRYSGSGGPLPLGSSGLPARPSTGYPLHVHRKRTGRPQRHHPPRSHDTNLRPIAQERPGARPVIPVGPC
jgi:hypothetical protein